MVYQPYPLYPLPLEKGKGIEGLHPSLISLLQLKGSLKGRSSFKNYSSPSPLKEILKESQREANTGPPQKQSFCGVRSLSYITDFPLPCKGRGTKGEGYQMSKGVR